MTLLGWLTGGKPRKGILLGNDCSGKTTALYQLKLGKTVTTIPTIGFNVEEIKRGPRGDFELWDIGGCDQMRALVRHYLLPGRFILFLHNCTENEGERLKFSLEYLRQIVAMAKDAGILHMWVLLTKQDLVPKDERPEVVRRLREIFELEIRKFSGMPAVRIIDTPNLNALNPEPLHAALDQVKQTMDHDKTARPVVARRVVVGHYDSSAEEMEKRAKEAMAQQPSSEVFWSDFKSGSVSSWGHCEHLRSGYFVLLEASAKGRGIMECTDTFLEHLARLREVNPQRFRNTAHRTMAIFWLSMLQTATIQNQLASGRTSSTRDDFADVLLRNSWLMNTSLWQRHYSKKLMFSQVARERWCMPDLEPLPASYVDTDVSSPASLPEIAEDPDRLLRFAILLVQTSMGSSASRGAIIKHALPALEQSTIRLRALKYPIPQYSETQAYFWIQFVHACLASVGLQDGRSMSLSVFKDRFRVTGQEWAGYYSEKIWESMDSRISFISPDLKPLPNVLNVPFKGKAEHSSRETSQQLTLNEAMARLVAEALNAGNAS